MVLEYAKRSEEETTARRKRQRASIDDKDQDTAKREKEMRLKDGERRKAGDTATPIAVNGSFPDSIATGQTDKDDSQKKSQLTTKLSQRGDSTPMHQNSRDANVNSLDDYSCVQTETAAQSRSASALGSGVKHTVGLVSHNGQQQVVAEVTAC